MADRAQGQRSSASSVSRVVLALEHAAERFVPPEVARDAEHARRARMAIWLAWTASAIFFTLSFAHYAAGNRAAIPIDLACGTLDLLAPFAIRRFRRVTPVAHGVFAIVFAAITTLVTTTRGPGLSGATLTLAIAPLFATWIVGTGGGLFWMFASLATTGVIGLLGHAGLIQDHLSRQARLASDHAILVAFTVLFFALAAIFEHRRLVALRQVASLEEAKRLADLESTKAQSAALLAEVQHLAALGRIAAATGHDINNPLAVVLGNLELLTEASAYEKDTELRASIDEALDGARRIEKIVKDMRLRRPEGEKLTRVVVADVVRRALDAASGEVDRRARVRTDFEAVPPIEVDETRLVQVIEHLVSNAVEAIEPGHPNENEIAVRVFSHRNAVAIEVTDTGRGIAPEHLSRVREPFFTTKEDGAGVGLSLCDAILQSYGGSLRIDTSDGRTSARVTLPASTAADAPERSTSEE